VVADRFLAAISSANGRAAGSRLTKINPQSWVTNTGRNECRIRNGSVEVVRSQTGGSVL
jgi:hypothetical protein